MLISYWTYLRIDNLHIFYLVLALITQQCPALLFDSVGKVMPPDPYVFVGNVLNLTCIVTDHDKYPGNVSDSLYFTKMYGDDERALPMEYIKILDSRSIRLEYPVNSGEDQGPFVCQANTSKIAKVINQQYVRVEHRPLNITEVYPVVDDWRSMIVTWDLGQEYINPNLLSVQLLWTVNPQNPTMYLCSHNTMTSCSWMENDGEDSFKMMTYHIIIRVTTFRQETGKVETAQAESIFEVNPFNYVKPAPVLDLTVVDRNSSCISLSWTNPSTSSLQNLLHIVLVTKESKLQQNRSTQESAITICDLHPDTTYSFNISCIPVYGGHISEWRDTDGATLQDIPTGAPRMAPSSFQFHSCENTVCNVTIYWQPVAKDKQNGEITHYRLRITEEPADGHQLNRRNETTVSGAERWADFHVQKDRAYRVEVTAATAVGYSKRSAVLILPSQRRKPRYPYNLVVETDGTRLFVSWDSSQQADSGYTVYYCSGSTRTFKCVDDINWIHLPANQTFYSLDMLDNILIGVSADREVVNHHSSSGIYWSECIYVRDKEPAQLKNVKFPPGQLEQALRIEWERPTCTGETPYILYYVISFCESINNRCTGAIVEQNVSNAEQSHVIKDLTVGIIYGVTVRAASRAGLGPESARIFKKVVTSGLSTTQLAAIAVGGVFFFLLVMAIGVFFVRRIHRNVKNIKIPIQVPRDCNQFDEAPDLPQRAPQLSSENNNNEETKKLYSTENLPNTSGDEEADSNTGKTDSNGGHELTSDTAATEHNLDFNCSSTDSSTSGSATSTTALIFESHPKQKAPILSLTLPSIGSSSTDDTTSGYKALGEVMRTDSSQTGSTDPSYSTVTTDYQQSPVSSPGGYVSDSSQMQLIVESPSPTDDKQLQLKPWSLPGIKEQRFSGTPKVGKGTMQNSDYIQYGQDMSEGSSTAASYSKLAAGSLSFSEGDVSDQQYIKENSSSLVGSKALHQTHVPMSNTREKISKEQKVQNDDYVQYG